MTIPAFHPEWYDQNQKARYPFADSATLSNASGGFIADDVFLDLALYPIGGQERTFLSRVIVASEEITVFFGDTLNRFRCSGSFSPAELPDTVEIVDVFGRPAGLIVSRGELLAQLEALGLGAHDFTSIATEICAACVTPTPEIGVRGFLLDDGSVVSGAAWLVGGDGVVITYEPASLGDDCGDGYEETVISVNAVGDPLYRRTLCDPIELFTTPRVLTKLRIMNNCEYVATITPDARGDVKILAGHNLASDTILRIRPVPGGMRIEMARSVI